MNPRFRSCRIASSLATGLILFLSTALTGCITLDVGALFGHSTAPQGKTTLGPRMAVRLQPLGSQSLVAGVEQEFPLTPGRSTDFVPWRTSLLLGYTRTPLPYESRVGAEIVLRGGMGRAPVGADLPVAWHTGAELGLPIRLSRFRPRWKADGLSMANWLLVPALRGTWYFTDMPGVEIGAGLSFRMHIWTGVAP